VTALGTLLPWISVRYQLTATDLDGTPDRHRPARHDGLAVLHLDAGDAAIDDAAGGPRDQS
jgi:hypothetical protein